MNETKFGLLLINQEFSCYNWITKRKPWRKISPTLAIQCIDDNEDNTFPFSPGETVYID